jgi:hypothetical protein
MDTSFLSDVIVPIVVSVVIIPLAFQYVNYISQRLHGSNLQTQINDNTAINNTSVQGTAGQENVTEIAKKSV